jgi:hypothetical protein
MPHAEAEPVSPARNLLHRYRLLWLTAEEAWESRTRKTAGGLGVLLILAAIVGGGVKGAGIEIAAVSSVPRQALLGLAGGLLLFVAMLTPRVKAPATAVLNDAVFWKEVFNVLPPAFIKEFPDPENVTINAPLAAFQGDFRPGNARDDKRRALIKTDHMRGDENAANAGESLQIELCDVSAVRAPKKILTYKKRIEYAGRIFIVGWCAPIELDDQAAHDEVISVKELGRQPVFELMPPSNAEGSLSVRLGRSIREGRAAFDTRSFASQTGEETMT